MLIDIVKNTNNIVEVRTQQIMKGDIILCSFECEDDVSWSQKMASLREEFKTLSQAELLQKYEMQAFKNSLNSYCIKGRRYVNTTPHPINFGYEDNVIVLPCSGHVINAQAQEVTVIEDNGVEYVTTQFVRNEEGENLIKKIKEVYPDAIIIGSIIAAQAYPRKVVALTPCKGYERVAPSEKRMNLDKFTIF